MDDAGIVIVGAGHGGAATAIALRQQGYADSLTLVGRELLLPYERPPLSKEYLAREKPFDRLLIRPESFWRERQVALRLGSAVTVVDPAAHSLTLEDGSVVPYRKLVWAAGGDAHRLNCTGSDLRGVHPVRDRADVDRIMAELDDGARRIAVVGGGYIGLEAAAVLTKLGCSVTVLEALPRVLARVAGEPVSRFIEAYHAAHGVSVRPGSLVDRLEGENGTVRRVVLRNGADVECDLVVVGVGIAPAIGPLADAGASVANGVQVDGFCRTTLPDVYAIGDCAAHRSRWADDRFVRLESVQNANDMATCVARHILGGSQPYDATPWFWSNQFQLKLQTVGLSTGYDDLVVRGDPCLPGFSVIYLREGRVVAIDALNQTKDYVQGRKLVESASRPSVEALADTAIPLKDLV